MTSRLAQLAGWFGVKLKLRPDWKKILLKADSMKWIGATVILTAAEVYFQWRGPPPGIPLGLFAALSAITSTLAGFFRVRTQKEFLDADK